MGKYKNPVHFNILPRGKFLDDNTLHALSYPTTKLKQRTVDKVLPWLKASQIKR